MNQSFAEREVAELRAEMFSPGFRFKPVPRWKRTAAGLLGLHDSASADGGVMVVNREPVGDILSYDRTPNLWLNLGMAEITLWMIGGAANDFDRMQLGTDGTTPVVRTEASLKGPTAAAGLGETSAITLARLAVNSANDTYHATHQFQNTSGSTVGVQEMTMRNSALVSLNRSVFTIQNVLHLGTLDVDYKLTLNPV